DAIGLVAAVRGLAPRSREAMEAARELAGIVTDAPAPRWAAPAPIRPVDDGADLTLALSCGAPLDQPRAADVARYLEGRGLLEVAHAAGWRALDDEEVLYQIDERLGMEGEPTDL